MKDDFFNFYDYLNDSLAIHWTICCVYDNSRWYPLTKGKEEKNGEKYLKEVLYPKIYNKYKNIQQIFDK